jgi:hypothetical protein
MITADQAEVINFLSAPSSHGGRPVERIETHGSVLFFAGVRAWKLKRAVKYDYMDFSTAERRRIMCDAEVRLNRRLAPEIYLDVVAPYSKPMPLVPYANDTRFDWSSAVSTPSCGHRRDFVFNAGFYTDTDLTGAGPRYVISASTNAGRGSSFPKNPGRDPFPVNAEGWYAFEHRFYAVPPTPGGVLRVDLTIKDAAGLPLHTWTLSDPSDIIGTTIGGNRYGWFATDEFPYLAFDTSALIGFQDYCTTPPSTAGAKVTGGGWITVAGGKGTFGLTAKADSSGAPSGNLTYQDNGLLDRTVKSTSINSVTLNGNCAQITGTARVDGTPGVGFDVNVCDNGEPGKDEDTFSIFMSDGYAASGTLGGGNVQIH